MSVTSEQIFAEISQGYGAGTIDDPYPLLAQRRRTEPVMEGDIMAELGLPSFFGHEGSRPTYTLFRYEDIARGLRDAETFSSEIWIEVMEPLLGRTILGMGGGADDLRDHRLPG